MVLRNNMVLRKVSPISNKMSAFATSALEEYNIPEVLLKLAKL